MTFKPSAKQLEAFNSRDAARPVALLVQYDLAQGVSAAAHRTDLAKVARTHDGKLIWAAQEKQVFIGALEAFGYAALFHFDLRHAAGAFVDEIGSDQRFAALRVEALSAQPRSVAMISRVLAWLLPKLPFDNSTEESEEPGVGVSGVMPSRAAIDELKANPSQNTPVTMINWLKFRGADGRAAYYRYGKVALVATHSIGAKLIHVGRYLQTLIGSDGDPAIGLWDEFALMQYPGRSSFQFMASLKRYRRALHHREAGLTERGQGLVVTEPCAEFTWRP